MPRKYKMHTIPITTDGDGAATVYSEETIYGRILQLRYEPGNIDTGADIVITGEITGTPILTLTNAGTSNIMKAPRQAVHNVAAGAALLYASGGEPVTDFIYLSGERLKAVVAQGTAAKTGKLYLWVDG